MPADTDQPTLAVTQADRVAAAPYMGFAFRRVLAGECDDSGLVQQFARHRTNSEPLATSEDRSEGNSEIASQRQQPRPVAGLREVLEQIAINSNCDWDQVRKNPRKQIDLIHTIAVDAFYGSATLSPGATSLEGGEGVERIVSRAIHEHLSRRNIMQYLNNEEDCQGLARSVLAALATHSPAPMAGIPADILAHVAELGRVEWGQTPAHDAVGHGRHVADSVRMTAAHFGQSGDQHMHGLWLAGTETVLCHTGTSPNAPVTTQALVGMWNWLVDQAAAPTSTQGV